jgi:hypothetical protein
VCALCGFLPQIRRYVIELLVLAVCHPEPFDKRSGQAVPNGSSVYEAERKWNADITDFFMIKNG